MTRNSFVRLTCALLFSGVTSVAWAGQAAAVSADDVAALRAELARLKDDVAQLRAEVSALKQGPAPAAPSPEPAAAESAAVPLEATVAILQAQVAEQAQTKVESSSRLPVKIFGTIHSSTSFNSGEANWLENPNIVSAPTSAPGEGSFSSTLRQSRIGVTLDGLRVGSMRAGGVLAWDFFGGAPGFQTGQVMGLPRLLYAFSRLEWDRTTIEVGQDDMVLAPRNPTSLAAFAFPDLFRSGNLYLRVPQIRIEQRVAGGDASRLTLTGAIVAPIAGDFPATYTFAPPALAGERTKLPAIQARAAWTKGPAEMPAFSLGVSGHYGQRQSEPRDLDSWAAAIDFDLNAGRFGSTGEFFVSDHAPQFGAALGQLARARGGFVEGRYLLTERLSVVGGVGMDDASRTVVDLLGLERNTSGFGNVTFRFSPELAASFEYRYLVTRPFAGDDRRNHHFNWVLARSF